MSAVSKAIGILKRYGLRGTINKAAEKRQAPDREFDRVKNRFYAGEEELKSQRIAQGRFEYRPLISIVVPSFRSKEQLLKELLISIKNQTYENWELVIADGASEETAAARRIVEEAKDSRIRFLALSKNTGISGNTNAAVKEAAGEYIGFLDYDDVLTPDALYEVVRSLNHDLSDLLYSDEDKISEDGSFAFQPHLKSDYNYCLLLANNYICHFTVVSRSLLQKVAADGEAFRPAFDGSQDYDFILRCVEKTDRITHIPKILYHWRVSSTSTAGDSYTKTYTEDAGKRALTEHLKRMGIGSEVRNRLEIGCYDIVPVPRERTKIGVLGKKTICGGKVDSCGLYYRSDGTVGHAFQGLKATFKGYCRRAVLLQEMSGVLLGYAWINPEALAAAGKPDDALPEPLRSMEFCERVRSAGYRIVTDPNETAEVPVFSTVSDRPSENLPKVDPYFFGVQKVLDLVK